MCASCSTSEGRFAAHKTQADESVDEIDRGREVQHRPLGAGDAARDRAFLRGEDDVIQVALKRGRYADDKRARDIGDVTVDFGTGIDQHELAVARGACAGLEVEHRGIGAGADDRAVAGARGAGAKKLRLELDL